MTSCQTTNLNTLGGATLGGIAGGIGGNQIGDGRGRVAAIIGGTLVGAALGGYIGSYMDKIDKIKMNNALETYPTNATSSWQNPDTNVSYSVTPKRTYMSNNNYCREYQTSVFIDGKQETAYGTACRQSDGRWKIQ